MSNSFTSVSISGYNSSPPPDDGTQSEANKIKWSTVKTKLTDPFDTGWTSLMTNLQSGFEYVEAGVVGNSFTTAGSSGTYTLATGKTVTPYSGMILHVVWNHANTGAATLNVDTDGAAPIQMNGAALSGGELSTNNFDTIRYDGTNWDLQNDQVPANLKFHDVIALSDETSDLETGTKATWYSPPYAITLTDIEASVVTAPTGAELIIDLHAGGTTVMSTDKCDIEVSEFHTKDAATQPALTTTAIAANTKFEAIIDQVGSTVAGAGAKLYIYYTID